MTLRVLCFHTQPLIHPVLVLFRAHALQLSPQLVLSDTEATWGYSTLNLHELQLNRNKNGHTGHISNTHQCVATMTAAQI